MEAWESFGMSEAAWEHLERSTRGMESVECELREKAGPSGWSRVKGMGKVGDEGRRAVRSEDGWPGVWILLTSARRSCGGGLRGISSVK